MKRTPPLPSWKPNLFHSSTLRALDKVCGKLISIKLVLRDATQLKERKRIIDE